MVVMLKEESNKEVKRDCGFVACKDAWFRS